MHYLLLIAVALLPAVVLVYHIYRRDKYQPEPTAQLLKGAGWGILSCFVALRFAAPFTNIAAALGGMDTVAGSLANAFLVAAVPEECAKAMCLYYFLKKNPYFDEYMDGIVYAVAVGMGFAGLENILYVVQADDWMAVGAVRALLTVPAHFGFAVLMGYFYSLWRINGDKNSRIQMFVAPILAHGIYDGILMTVHFSPAVGVLLLLVFGVFLHYLRVTCSRFIERQLKRDLDASNGYNRDEHFIGGCSDGREDV